MSALWTDVQELTQSAFVREFFFSHLFIIKLWIQCISFDSRLICKVPECWLKRRPSHCYDNHRDNDDLSLNSAAMDGIVGEQGAAELELPDLGRGTQQQRQSGRADKYIVTTECTFESDSN